VTRVSDRYLEQLTTTALHKARRLALSRSGHHGAQDTIDAVEYRVATVGAFPTVGFCRGFKRRPEDRIYLSIWPGETFG